MATHGQVNFSKARTRIKADVEKYQMYAHTFITSDNIEDVVDTVLDHCLKAQNNIFVAGYVRVNRPTAWFDYDGFIEDFDETFLYLRDYIELTLGISEKDRYVFLRTNFDFNTFFAIEVTDEVYKNLHGSVSSFDFREEVRFEE